MPSDPFVELRGEVLRDHVDVIVDRKTHEAMLIQRVTKGNGTAPESDRSRAGRIAE